MKTGRKCVTQATELSGLNDFPDYHNKSWQRKCARKCWVHIKFDNKRIMKKPILLNESKISELLLILSNYDCHPCAFIEAIGISGDIK